MNKILGLLNCGSFKFTIFRYHILFRMRSQSFFGGMVVSGQNINRTNAPEIHLVRSGIEVVNCVVSCQEWLNQHFRAGGTSASV